MAWPFKIELQDLLERDKLVYGINCGKKSTSSDVLGSLQLRKILLRQKKPWTVNITKQQITRKQSFDNLAKRSKIFVFYKSRLVSILIPAFHYSRIFKRRCGFLIGQFSLYNQAKIRVDFDGNIS